MVRIGSRRFQTFYTAVNDSKFPLEVKETYLVGVIITVLIDVLFVSNIHFISLKNVEC